MKVLSSIVIGLLIVGCGDKEPLDVVLTAPETEPKIDTTKPVKEPLSKSVEIDDPIVEEEIRKTLKIPIRELTKADLEKVTELNLGAKKLTELPKGLEKLTQLKRLHLMHNQLTSVKDLENFTQVTAVSLGNNQLTDVTGLEKLDQLTFLDLTGNKLTDVKVLENLMQF